MTDACDAQGPAHGVQDRPMEVRDKVADTPVRQFDVSCRYDIDSPSTRNHHRPRTNQEGMWCGGPWPAATLQRVAIWASTRTACTCSSSPMCHPDANQVHIKIHIMKARKNDVKLWEKVKEKMNERASLRRTVAVGAWFFRVVVLSREPKKNNRSFRLSGTQGM